MKTTNKVRHDVALPRFSFDEVSWALHELFKVHKQAALNKGMSFIDFLCDEELAGKYREEQETMCILMGWTLALHQEHEHNETIASMQAEQ